MAQNGKIGETRAIYIPHELWQRLREQAEREQRSTSGQARFYLERHLAAAEADREREAACPECGTRHETPKEVINCYRAALGNARDEG